MQIDFLNRLKLYQRGTFRFLFFNLTVPNCHYLARKRFTKSKSTKPIVPYYTPPSPFIHKALQIHDTVIAPQDFQKRAL